jgi:hypothetical protein
MSVLVSTPMFLRLERFAGWFGERTFDPPVEVTVEGFCDDHPDGVRVRRTDGVLGCVRPDELAIA